MARTRKADLWDLVNDYFDIHLKDVRRMSGGTILTYRYGLFSFVSYLNRQKGIDAGSITLEDFSRLNVKDYIAHMGSEEGLSPATCNLRLSIIKSFLRFCADEYVHLYALYHSVKAIPISRIESKPVDYLSEEALRTLLLAPDPSSRLGRRDGMLLIFMYDTACRVQELVDVRLGDVRLDRSPSHVVITGKGNKTRLVPLMEKTVAHLRSYIHMFHPSGDGQRPLFYASKRGGPSKLSTDAVAALMKKYGKKAGEKCLELSVSRIHPHLMRKTRSMHLYMNGMPLENVAKFLGHVDSSSISHYAQANLNMLMEAIEKANPEVVGVSKNWKDPDILRRLMGL